MVFLYVRTTGGITPELLRRLRVEVEQVSRKLTQAGYPAPSDPWNEFSKLQSGKSTRFTAF